ncbi:hypothetical protein L1987_61688 [Smallanthus sonchifolius]|uniref:Uncharacterized protein n=1 Tax=Smallanthus sonchifolius TaxID=185202 RepID=A0ACB9C8L3_9ASTR|nr:hypothetical protein L1987_61688 [Smallanthus sonchifolius]
MAVAVFKSPIGQEYHRIGRKSTRSRRVFVQTESGCVLGMELDRNDNVLMVKRRVQFALNVPIEESCLTFGDMVLKNDLSAIRKDSPLLLTRSLMHRSSSTPCLSPSGKDIQNRDPNGPIEILCKSTSFSRTKELVDEIAMGIKSGVDPIRVNGGLGGAYYFRNSGGESVAIVKPTDEEPFAPNNPKGFVGKALGQPGLKQSVRVGETGFREVAAYLLDYDHFANVPPTALVKITHSIFNVNDSVSGSNNKKQDRNKKHVCKIASLQQFMPHDFDASDHGTSSFPVSAVHRIGILDIRIFNTDRHAGNLLVRKVNDDVKFEDPYFEWIHWPQASIPFSEDELDYIESLDLYRDAEMLRNELPMIREACLRVLTLCTIFLKEAAGYGMCLAEIGEMMSREFRRGEEGPSDLEMLCMEARRLVAEREKEMEMFVLSPKPESREYGFQFEIDCNDSEIRVNPVHSILPFQFGNWYGRNPLSKLEEEENEEDLVPASGKVPSMLLNKNLSLGDSSAGHQSAPEQVPESARFVKVADMTDQEWGLFLDKFEGLLHRAFTKQKMGGVGQRQRQRMGTSCQF